MSKFFTDLEFHEYFIDDKIPTIDLISIAIVNKDGREFYKINRQHNLEDSWQDEWLRDNVLKQIYNELVPESEKKYLVFCLSTMIFLFKNYGLTRKEIAESILSFIGKDKNVEFYGYYADYDWVMFCWIFGRMIDLPHGWQQWMWDLKQMMAERNLTNNWKKKIVQIHVESTVLCKMLNGISNFMKKLSITKLFKNDKKCKITNLC